MENTFEWNAQLGVVRCIIIARVFFSIVVIAVCDSNYGFMMVDIGEYGSNNDSGVLMRSEINRRFEEV